VSFLRGLFGPPNVDRMRDRGDVEGLIETLGYQKDPEVRKAAAAALGRIGDVRAVEPLVAALQDEDDWVGGQAALALGSTGDPRAVSPLIAALREGQRLTRSAAADALGSIGDARAVGPLIDALGDSPADMYAAKALGEIGDARAVGPLISALEDGDRTLRAAGADALGRLGDARAVDALKRLLEDEHQAVRRASRGALDRIPIDQAATGHVAASPPPGALPQEAKTAHQTEAADGLAGAVSATLESLDGILDAPLGEDDDEERRPHVEGTHVVQEGEGIVGFWIPEPSDAETKLRTFISLSLVDPPASYRVAPNEADDRGGFFLMFDAARAPGETDAQYEAAMAAERSFAQGAMAARSGDFPQALRHFEQALVGQPYSPEAWNNKAFALANLNRNEKAVACCDRAIELKPSYADPWDIKGRCLGRLGRFREAVPVIERYIELAPKNDVHAPRVRQAERAVRSLRARLGT